MVTLNSLSTYGKHISPNSNIELYVKSISHIRLFTILLSNLTQARSKVLSSLISTLPACQTPRLAQFFTLFSQDNSVPLTDNDLAHKNTPGIAPNFFFTAVDCIFLAWLKLLAIFFKTDTVAPEG